MRAPDLGRDGDTLLGFGDGSLQPGVEQPDDRHLTGSPFGRQFGYRGQGEPCLGRKRNHGHAERCLVVRAAERDGVHDVAGQPQPVGGGDVNLAAQRRDDVHPGVHGQPHQVVECKAK
jgi:hypothetical protein